MSELTASHKQTGTFVYINNYRGYIAKLLTSTPQSPVSHEWHVQTWRKFTSKTITASESLDCAITQNKHTKKKMGNNKGYGATPMTDDIPTNFKRSEKINPWLWAVYPEAHILSCLMIVLIAVKQQCFSATDIVEDSHNFVLTASCFVIYFNRWNLAETSLFSSSCQHITVFSFAAFAHLIQTYNVYLLQRCRWTDPCDGHMMGHEQMTWCESLFKAKWCRENWR